MHVLFLNARYAPEGIGGPAFSVQFLAEQLVEEGDQATVLCRTQYSGVVQEMHKGVRVVRAGMNVSPQAIKELIGQVLDEYQPDVVHTNYLREFPISALPSLVKNRGLRLVHTIHEFSFICIKVSPSKDGRLCSIQCPECRSATVAARILAEQVDAVVGVSRFVLELHEQMGLFGTTPMKRVIYNPYAPPTQCSAPKASGATLRLGYLGRLSPEKGIESLLRTLLHHPIEDDWTLTVAGVGAQQYETMLKQSYAEPRVKFIGFVRPSQLFDMVDVLIIPSVCEEPQARVMIEAYAHGVPVIASRRGGMPELVEQGETGLQFDPANPNDLVSAILLLMKDRLLLERMRAPALRKAKQFLPEVILRQLREVYTGGTQT